ncbi:MAG: M48 family metalloprotease, partial [Helicobacteraceae bacterium]|nr:M48 family metalloprotease [Helicobacteraceae bacterium]
MNFRERQRLARRNSARLIALFTLSVFTVVFSIWYMGAAINRVIVGSASVVYPAESVGELAQRLRAEEARGGAPRRDRSGGFFVDPLLLYSETDGDITLLLVFAALMMIFFGGSSMENRLKGDGNAVAKALGAQLASPLEPSRKRLINIVEETALASGVSSPSVYVLRDDEAINALAAGESPKKAAIVVTSGALRYLNRDELQGVIAHEFSHILNGDMKLNMRAAYLLYGLAFISETGAIVFRRDESDEDRVVNPLLTATFFILIPLFIIGVVGEICASAIKSALNRQREFLADASAVQFTRQIDGITGALKKIGGLKSTIKTPLALVFSHFFFASGVINIFGSHPSLEERIRRVDPKWDRQFIIPKAITYFDDEPAPPARQNAAELADATLFLDARNDGESRSSGSSVDNEPTRGIYRLKKTAFAPVLPQIDRSSSTPIALKTAASACEDSQESDPLSLARAYIEAIYPYLRDRALDPLSARWIIYALLIDADEKTGARQRTIIAKRVYIDEFDRIENALSSLKREHIVHLIFLCANALKSLTFDQYIRFREGAELLIEED